MRVGPGYTRAVSFGTLAGQRGEGSGDPGIEEHDAIMMFTSGTSLQPKGAILYHGALARAATVTATELGLDNDDVMFTPQPLFRIGGLTWALASLVGGRTLVVQKRFDAEEALDLMVEHGATVTTGHQPHYVEYLASRRLAALKPQLRLRKAMVFASPKIKARVRRELGIEDVISPFGSTETHAASFWSRIGVDPREACETSAGRPTPGTEMRILDADSEEASEGRLLLRGWCLMRGYAGAPELTHAAIDENGWFHTGDLVRRRSDGFIELVGRLSDVIRVGGESVDAAEVEDVLLTHSAVKQAVVVGMPDERLGEVCVAHLEFKEGADVTATSLIEFCSGHLAKYKVPRAIVLRRQWPMTATGKIARARLAEEDLDPAAEEILHTAASDAVTMPLRRSGP